MKNSKMSFFSLVALAVAGLTFLAAGPSFAYTDDILALWALEEEDPPYADSIGDNPAQSILALQPTRADGQVGFSGLFNGASDEVWVTAPDDFDFATGSFSIEFWVNTVNDVNPANAYVVVGRDDPATGVSWWIGASNTTGRAAFYLKDSDGVEPYQAAPLDSEVGDVAGAAKITDGTWHYVVAVKDGDSGTLEVYVDSVLQESRAIAYTGDFASVEDVSIGYWEGAGGGFTFNGRIDELAIYDRALPQDEIDDHFAAGTAGDSVTTLGLDPGPVTPSSTPSDTSSATPTATGGDGGGGGCFIGSLF